MISDLSVAGEMASSEGFSLGVQILTWWVAIYLISTGGYLIFVAERRLPLLGVLLGEFGVGVYCVVQLPEYLPPWMTRSTVLSVVLVSLAIFVLYATTIIWRYFELIPPWIRIRDLVCDLFRD